MATWGKVVSANVYTQHMDYGRCLYLAIELSHWPTMEDIICCDLMHAVVTTVIMTIPAKQSQEEGE